VQDAAAEKAVGEKDGMSAAELVERRYEITVELQLKEVARVLEEPADKLWPVTVDINTEIRKILLLRKEASLRVTVRTAS